MRKASVIVPGAVLVAAILLSASAAAAPQGEIISPAPIGPQGIATEGSPVPLPERPRARPPPPTEPSIPVPQQSAPPSRPPVSAKPKPAPKPPADQSARSQADGAYVMLVRSAIAALQHANATGDYAVLRSLATPQLQAKLTAEEFKRSFASLRQQGADLSPALVVAPRFTEQPSGLPTGSLHLAGYFPTQPLQINFVIVYRAIDDEWLIDALSVSTVAPGSAETRSPAKQPPQKAPQPKPSEAAPRAPAPQASAPHPAAPDAPPAPEPIASKPANEAKSPAAVTPAATGNDARLNAVPELPLLRDAAKPKGPSADSDKPAPKTSDKSGDKASDKSKAVAKAAKEPVAKAGDATPVDAPAPSAAEVKVPPPPLPKRKPHPGPNYVQRAPLAPLPQQPKQAD